MRTRYLLAALALFPVVLATGYGCSDEACHTEEGCESTHAGEGGSGAAGTGGSTPGSGGMGTGGEGGSAGGDGGSGG
jgi:hypothetical protein